MAAEARLEKGREDPLRALLFRPARKSRQHARCVTRTRPDRHNARRVCDVTAQESADVTDLAFQRGSCRK
ncbi:Hypothetical predicted protein [Pelobates cultripes]|uniref:Uncharacterized protein n=1 Tax=Pelobates cultripes TaxID=61616 RepID=A0AAD1TAR9_PELCU|nr:Hypothetical predicted protein [Pelobates cultripes]